MPDSITYESWNFTLGSLPKRSHLYHLRPIGIGTRHVESLTGYVARLAEAHSVPTGALLTVELLPHLQQDHSARQRAVARNYAFIYDAYVLNGIAECPRNWVRVLQSLTRRSSLHVLTMLTWSRVISDIHLLRNSRAWCPYCFDCWRNADLPAYEPLIWAIACVSICPIHQHRMETRCPNCERETPLLTAKACPGHCYRCRSWLGKPWSSGQSIDAASPYDAQLSVATAVGELLALAPGLPESPSGVYFKHNFRRSIDEFADGNHSLFARMCGVSLHSVYRWLHVNRGVDLVHLGLDRVNHLWPGRHDGSVVVDLAAGQPDLAQQILFERLSATVEAEGNHGGRGEDRLVLHQHEERRLVLGEELVDLVARDDHAFVHALGVADADRPDAARVTVGCPAHTDSRGVQPIASGDFFHFKGIRMRSPSPMCIGKLRAAIVNLFARVGTIADSVVRT
jgi:TniQ